MIDLDTALLPCQGAGGWQEAIDRCRRAADDGVRVAGIVVPTHGDDGPSWPTAWAQYRVLQLLCRRLLEDRLKITFAVSRPAEAPDLGPEAGAVVGREDDDDWLGLTPGRFLRIVLPPRSIPRGLREMVFGLAVAGQTPVLCYPERNRVLSRRRSLVRDLVLSGALVQVAAGSILGDAGKTTREAVETMITDRAVHLVTSGGAPPGRLASARDALEQLVGPEGARQLLEVFPADVVDNRRPATRRPRLQPRARRRGLRWVVGRR